MVMRKKLLRCTQAQISTAIFDSMRFKNLSDKTFVRLKIIVFLLALCPLVKLIFYGCLDILGANPIEKITRTTGYWTLLFLLITLAATPIRRLLKWQWVNRLRRMLGLFSFFYGCLHFLTYLILDHFFDWEAILKDILKRPYITVGFVAFVLMLPLAITSSDSMMRRLGGKRWRLLHRLVYVTAIAGVVHYWWLVKKDLTDPIIFGVVLANLLSIRIFYKLKNPL
jgi:sulfoxide reductase heme-binding subunit YedZ